MHCNYTVILFATPTKKKRMKSDSIAYRKYGHPNKCNTYNIDHKIAKRKSANSIKIERRQNVHISTFPKCINPLSIETNIATELHRRVTSD